MRSFSALSLLVANFIPLIGVLFYEWNAVLILALFWIENLIIGAFNVIKILFVIAHQRRFKELFICAFFVLHYGLFCSVHGTVLWDLLNLGELDPSVYFSNLSLGPLELFQEGATVFLNFVAMFGQLIILGMVALSLSHFVSFIENFILRGELFTHKANNLMAKPYAQILVMHAGLIIGAIAIEEFGSSVWLVALIVLFKIAVDLTQHLRRRKKGRINTELIKDI